MREIKLGEELIEYQRFDGKRIEEKRTHKHIQHHLEN